MFQQFDSKHDGLIDFEEFVQALSTFHPNATQTEKAFCMAVHSPSLTY